MLFPTFTAKGPKTGIIYKPFSHQKENKKKTKYIHKNFQNRASHTRQKKINATASSLS